MPGPHLLVVLGTRPEAVKLAPLIIELRAPGSPFTISVCNTGQHAHMAAPVLDWFGIEPEITLDAMRTDATLSELVSRLFGQFSPLLAVEAKPDAVIVQGDTATAMAAATAAFFAQVPVAHVEAGLRTGNLQEPFPEEFNRRVISLAAQLHFAPTPDAAFALAREGVDPANIFTVGNTVIDALRLTRDRLRDRPPSPRSGPRILVTAHRRESFGAPFEEICRALCAVVERHSSATVYFPVHLNPNVRAPVERWLRGRDQIHLLEPASYQEFVALMLDSDLILTDSGGVQEEASALGRPTLVLRDRTERPEVLASGTARLVGCDACAIVSAVDLVLSDASVRAAMSRVSNVFGDGYASAQIVRILARRFQAVR